MTENEAIERLQTLNIILTDKAGHEEDGIEKIFTFSDITAICTAIQALEEIQQYRAIGTVEECINAVEKMKPKKVHISPCNHCDKELCDCECEHFAISFRDDYKCPTCDSNKVYMSEYEIKHDYCPNCGQAIDWSE